MDPETITTLANLLRSKGDKILSSEFKLTLTGSLLRALNDSFTLIADTTEIASNQSFQVVKPNNSKSNVFRDLQLVHDFVQKTILLCVTSYPEDDYFDGLIDLSKFRSLRCLEVQRTEIKQIIGIQRLRSQLQQLVCVRSLQSVVEIIEHCGGDQSNGFVWNELKSADFSYNNLQTVDSSLEFAQHLQHLNLRHNQLTSVEAIKWLPNLKTLDLSYNKLTTVPYFHAETLKRLQYLNLSNNLIEDLIGVSKLDLLTELDLSDNCLLDHSSLYPLSSLVTLKYLNLYGNPLFYHPKHRLATAQFLHRDTCTVKFMLNREPLSKNEKALTGTHQHNSYSSYAAINTANPRSYPIKQSLSDGTPTSSVGSRNSFQQSVDNRNFDVQPCSTERAKRVKVRQVIIECPEQINNGILTKTDSNTINANVSVNKEHLETKEKFKILRNKYGAGWLQNENAQIVHNLLGLSPTNSPTRIYSNTEITAKPMVDDYLCEINSTQMNNNLDLEICANSSKLDKSDLNKPYANADLIDPENFITTVADDKQSNKSLELRSANVIDEPLDIAPHLEHIYMNTVDDLEFSDVETDEESYSVHTLEKNEPLLLTLSSNYIREKESSNEKTRSKWSLKILQSCDRIKSNTLRINFDTMKMDKKERIYMVDEELCQELEKKLRAILSTRNLCEMNQTVFRCINCSCQFSEENRTDNRLKRDIFCPDCKSTFVTEIQNLSENGQEMLRTSSKDANEARVENQHAPANKKEAKLMTINPENSMQGSIGRISSRLIANNNLSRTSKLNLTQSSINSLNESSSCSKISNSQGSFESTQSVIMDKDNDSKTNCDSDVDVISNPSQSSIEVLDQLQTSRKNSEDQSQSANLKTTDDFLSDSLSHVEVKNCEDTKLSKEVLLIESSSSGSVTDSVCTTYDGNLTPIKSLSKEEINVPHVQLSKEKSIKKEESKLSSMFGGLLQSTNMLMSRTTQRFMDSESSSQQCEKYNFNYTDFNDVDHRLKFYFYQLKFEEQSEHLKWVVKGKIYNENTQTINNGIVAMSTVKLYVMEEIGAENDNISKWLRPIVSVSADRLELIQLLPWKVGLYLRLRGWGGFLLLLQDILRTDSLLFHFTKNALPVECTLNYNISENVLNRMTRALGEDQLKMFSLLNNCEVNKDQEIQNFSMSGLLTTNSRIFITANQSWLIPSSDCPLEIGPNQLMSNLVEVQVSEERIFILNFFDETKNTTELWTCTFETKENAASCIDAIGQSWETLFGVSLFNS